MHRSMKLFLSLGLFVFSLFISFKTFAGEGFRTHYSPAGALTGEAAVVLNDRPGFFGIMTGSFINTDQLNDKEGNNAANQSVYIKSFPSIATLFQNATGSNTLNIGQTLTQSQSQVNLIGGYVSLDSYWGGKLIGAVNIPYANVSRQVTATVDPNQIAQLQAYAVANPGIAANVNNTIRALTSQAASLAASKSGNAEGLGDIQLTGAWSHFNGVNTKYVASFSVTTPTGTFNENYPVNIGFGYYTFLPAMAVIYQEKEWTLAGRASYGYNTTNNSTSYKSGDFLAVELLGAYRMAAWANIGVNVIQFNQLTADSFSGAVTSISTTQSPGGLASLLGTSVPIDDGQKTTFTAISPFVVFPLPSVNSLLTFQYTFMPVAKDSIHANFMQARLTTRF